MVWILLKVDGDVTTFTCTWQNGLRFSVIESYLVRLLIRRARVEWEKGKSALRYQSDGSQSGDFEKGEANGAIASLALVRAVAEAYLSTVRGAQVANNVTVRIEDADLGNRCVRHAFLTTGLPQQVLGRKG
jgi:hypothetical protein